MDTLAPLDYSNSSDTRNVTLSVIRLRANSTSSLGTIFFNPGGPGISGYDLTIYGPVMSTIINNSYDIVSWDPRGVNLTTPAAHCFANALEEYIFAVGAGSLDQSLDLPVTLDTNANQIKGDLIGQLRRKKASLNALGQKCLDETGDELAYVGTLNAVREDMNFLSEAITGPGTPLNYWGVSYGTVIGQYLAVALPPERLGRIVIDGVVNVTAWAGYSKDRVISAFADFCIEGASNCALSYLNTSANILSTLHDLVDSLYLSPVADPSLDLPGGLVTAEYARSYIREASYQPPIWSQAAEVLALALRGNFSAMVTGTAPQLGTTVAQAINSSDSVPYANIAIACADAKPYDDTTSPESVEATSDRIWSALLNQTSMAGDVFYALAFCDAWPIPTKSYYGGPFTLQNNTLDTPMLILTNSLDPVTPIGGAIAAFEHVGFSNARLVEQNGTGHTTLLQPSSCTNQILAAYFLNHTAPEEAHSHCVVETLPFSSS
ncbi:hypothetical protein MNV49_003714 [Pseudohyphozyma bogoriensis]|nr:hypothetical protein MNV49_003714 [Pseudohyphozyma bogoriensis]